MNPSEAQIWLRTEEATKKKIEKEDGFNVQSITGNKAFGRRKSLHEKMFLSVSKKGMQSNAFDETARWLFPTSFFIFGKQLYIKLYIIIKTILVTAYFCVYSQLHTQATEVYEKLEEIDCL